MDSARLLSRLQICVELSARSEGGQPGRFCREREGEGSVRRIGAEQCKEEAESGGPSVPHSPLLWVCEGFAHTYRSRILISYPAKFVT